jgi:hypothetical protein
MGMRVSPHHILTVLGVVEWRGGIWEVQKWRSSRWGVWVKSRGIGDWHRKSHGWSEWSKMAWESGDWAIVVVITMNGGRKVVGCGGYRSEMERCLRGRSDLSWRVCRRMMECLLRHWSRLIEGSSKLEGSHLATRQI